MKSYELIERLRKARKPVLTTNDIAKFTTGTRKYASLLAQRLVKRGMLVALERGKYYLSETPVFAIASGMEFPSYISFLSALYINGLTEQLPAIVRVIVRKPKKAIKIGNTRIEFVTFPQARFFGYKKDYIDGWPVFVAEPEKTIADCIHLQKYCAGEYVKEALSHKIVKKGKIHNMLRKFYPKAALKRFKAVAKTGGKKND